MAIRKRFAWNITPGLTKDTKGHIMKKLIFLILLTSGCQHNYPVLIGTNGQCSRFSVAGHTWGQTEVEIREDAMKATFFMCGGKAEIIEVRPWVRDGQSHWGAIFECCDY